MNGEETARLRRDDRITMYVVGALVVIGFLLLLFWRSIFVVIPAGHAGVLYDLLFGGTRVWSVSSEGLTVKLPWNQIYIYDMRLQTKSHHAETLSREGMKVDIDVAALFRADHKGLPLLHKEIGPEYVQKVVSPIVVGIVREYVSRHDSHELYTVDSQALQTQIRANASALLADHHVLVDAIILERLALPAAVIEAVERKLAHEQAADAYAFRLIGEKAEAERLRIKAAGLQDYYSIVSKSLTPSLLTWRGIEATVELAQSPNSKIVIVGGGKDQMPLILGSDIQRLPAEPGGARPVPAPPRPAAERPALPRVFDGPEKSTPQPETAPAR